MTTNHEPSWKMDDTGHGLARLEHLTLEVYSRTGHGRHDHGWCVYEHYNPKATTGRQSAVLFEGVVEQEGEDGTTEAQAQQAAEQAARAWLDGVNRFGPGDAVEVELGWLADFYEVREDLERDGADPKQLVLLERYEDLDEADERDTPWSANCTVAEITWAPDNDAQAARLVDRWALYLEWRQLAEEQEETEQERAERVSGALDACREMSDAEAAEPVVDIEAPKGKPDEVRTEHRLTLIPLSDQAKLNMADRLAQQTVDIKRQREEARQEAKANNDRIKKLAEARDELAERYERGGDREPREHRIELHYSEKVAVVRMVATDEVVEVRAMLSKELQRSLPFDEPEGAPPEPLELPFAVDAGTELESIDSGRRCRVTEVVPGDRFDDGYPRAKLHQLTRDGDLDKRANASQVAFPAIPEAYRPAHDSGAPPAA